MEKDIDFKVFGYNSDKPCEICGEKPAKIEPRFSYVVCKEHQYLTPIQVSNLKTKYEKHI